MEYEHLDESWKIGDNLYQCPLCEKTYPKKGIMSHIRRTHQGVKFGDGYNGCYGDPGFKRKISDASKERYDSLLGPYTTYKVECYKCGKPFNVVERQSYYPSKDRYYCSRKCANTRNHTAETKEKIKMGVIKHMIENGVPERTCYTFEPKHYFCQVCGVEVTTNRKYCNGCLKKHRQQHMSELKVYRSDCSFQFHLSTYPEEFDFNLIKEHGWYSAANRGNNVNGVNRDHCVSIKYGFDNNIDPKIIRHPANCQLLTHSDNVTKYTKCSMTIEELLEKIEKWNNKYK